MNRLWLAPTLLLAACDDPAPVVGRASEAAATRPIEAPANIDEPADQPMIGVLVPAAEVVLVAPGFARLERLDPGLGDLVDEGELIAVLDLRAERSELASTTAAWRAAKAELERLELELEQARADRADVEQLEDYISAAELRERRFAEQLAAARQRSANASLSQQRSLVDAASERLREAELRAPFAAVIARRHVDPGATLTGGEPIVELLSQRRIVRFAVPERSASALQIGATLQVSFADAGLELVGEVSAIAPEIEAGTRLLFAEATLAGDTRALRIGTVARVRFSR
ncbi:MAG TPA: efflux RND transporter periplasmic adaptor subunit [Enhygromyxa sp.]|nr:efflux RND transporter periplasmic adaptor subunit [Enhygromyxa sp.]